MPPRTIRVSDHLNYRLAKMSLSQLDQWAHDTKFGNSKLDRPKICILLATSWRTLQFFSLPPVQLIYLCIRFPQANVPLVCQDQLVWLLLQGPRLALVPGKDAFLSTSQSFMVFHLADIIFVCSLYSSYYIKVYFIILFYT
jgi:hypothetical protein